MTKWQKTDYVTLDLDVANQVGLKNCIFGSKVTASNGAPHLAVKAQPLLLPTQLQQPNLQPQPIIIGTSTTTTTIITIRNVQKRATSQICRYESVVLETLKSTNNYITFTTGATTTTTTTTTSLIPLKRSPPPLDRFGNYFLWTLD